MTFRPENAHPSVRARRHVEYAITVAAVDALLAAGYLLAVWYDSSGPTGESDCEEPTRDRAKIMAALQECDEEWLPVWELPLDEKDTRPNAWVRFVYGNDNGENVISDYSMRLETVLAPVDEFAEKIGDGDAGAMMQAFAVYANAQAKGSV